MLYLKKYLDKITSKEIAGLAESISKTADDVGNCHLKHFSFTSHEIGLLFGNVQSGKTVHLLGLICRATDLGFPVFVLLTTDNVVLQQQTLERVRAELGDDYCICGENDAQIFANNSLMKPTVVVLKKNARILKLWASIFNSTGFMKGNPLFIIDDEADASSLNTLVNRKRQSSINRYLDSIRNEASSSIYLQVTATPQAIFLQTLSSGWHPLFTYYFRPGIAYLGGDFFFPRTGKPDCVTFVDNLKSPERDVVIRHLLVSAQVWVTGGTVSNCLIHPSVRQAEHQKFALTITSELDWCKKNLYSDFACECKKQYSLIHPSKCEAAPYSDIWNSIEKLLSCDDVKVIIMNGNTEVDRDKYSAGCNFIIGGNTLGRGITFPNLLTLYYSRSAKKPQADTMWQHSRMFGYDRDPGMMMVYIDERLYKLFADINATNNAIISQVEKGLDDVKIYYPEGLNPTRKNVLDKERISAISGGTNYYPLDPMNDTVEDISRLLSVFSETESYYQVSLRLMKEILSHVIPSHDFKLKSFLSIIDVMLAEGPTKQGILIVRRNRNVSQGTGALLSPNDWQLGSSFPDNIVLTMYQVTGTKGWGGKQLWVPNIKLPNKTIYYDVIDD